jgi:hypothetical protein
MIVFFIPICYKFTHSVSKNKHRRACAGQKQRKLTSAAQKQAKQACAAQKQGKLTSAGQKQPSKHAQARNSPEAGGCGIGVLAAAEDIRSWGANLTIESSINEGFTFSTFSIAFAQP